MISRYFIETFSKRFAMDKRSAPADRGERDRMRVAAMQSIGQELAAIGGSNPFRYPEAFPSILRAFTVLEGIGKTLDTQVRRDTKRARSSTASCAHPAKPLLLLLLPCAV